ncbi:HD-GYP domain-containing protein [Planctomycetaceae bacterium SH139]
MSIDTLPVGYRLADPIYDVNGVLLLDQGIVLTAGFVQTLRTRGIQQVRVGKPKAAPSKSPTPKAKRSSAFAMDRLLEQVRHRLSEMARRPLVKAQRAAEDFDPHVKLQFAVHIEESAAVISDVLAQIEAGELVDIDHIQTTTAQQLLDVTADVDLAMLSAFELDPEDEAFNQRLHRTALQSSVLSLAVGVQLGLDVESLLHLGTAAMLCDIGLSRHFPAAVRDPRDESRSDPRQSGGNRHYLQHPERGFEQLVALKLVPGPILQAVRQHHELIDGSGFPHGIGGQRVCLGARIIGVVQAYLALTEPLDASEGYLGADSVAYLMHHALEGRFDLRVMKAFVKTVSVYPIGSVVRLNDHRTGTVFRTCGGDSLRPVLRVEGEICDLQEGTLRIVEPLLEGRSSRRRLPTRLMREVLW